MGSSAVDATPPEHLLFDLDGTLTDSREGITACLQHALRELDEHCPSASELERFIGPPLSDAFQMLLARPDVARVERAIAIYRERYAGVGIYENRVFDGIPDLLDVLIDSGRTLYVVTSKPEIYARQIIVHFGLEGTMPRVHGARLDGGRSRKRDLIEYVLELEGIQPESAVMIGDREHDVIGARGAGVRSLGVTWGFGSRRELEEAGATGVVDSLAQCADWLGADARGVLEGGVR